MNDCIREFSEVLNEGRNLGKCQRLMAPKWLELTLLCMAIWCMQKGYAISTKEKQTEKKTSLLWDVTPRKVRSFTHEVSSTWLPKHDLSKGELRVMLTWTATSCKASALDKELQAAKGCREDG